MKKNRRDFFRLTGLAGLGLAGNNVLKNFSPQGNNSKKYNAEISGDFIQKSHVQKFNISGYAAPKLDVVRIGFIGVGSRGSGYSQHGTTGILWGNCPLRRIIYS